MKSPLQLIAKKIALPSNNNNNNNDDNDKNTLPSEPKRSFSSSPSSSSSRKRKEFLFKLSQGVQVKNRRYRFRMYKQCFVGSEAVDFMVESGWAKSREEAVIIGQKLQRDYHLFCHVCAEHEFMDGYLFYRFIEGGDDDDDEHCHDRAPSLTALESSDSGLLEDPHTRPSMAECEWKIGLLSIGEILRHDIQLYYKYSIDKECFTANEAIDFMVISGLAADRTDGIQIGRALQREGFIDSVDVVGGPYLFKDARLFYAFTPNNQTPDWEQDLEKFCHQLSNHIPVSDQTYHLKVYRDSFTGSAVVTTMLQHKMTSARRDAVLLGRAIMYEYQLFEHVTSDHTLEDDELFYRFVHQSKESSRVMEAFRQRRKNQGEEME